MDAGRDRIGDRLEHPERVPLHLQPLIQDDLQRVKRILDFPPRPPNMLDVGCSDGAVSIRLAERYPDVPLSVYDCDPEARQQARYRKLRVIMNCLPWRYGTVYATEVIEHMNDHDLRKLWHARDLVITTPNRTPATKYAGRERWDWPTHVRTWTKASLEASLTQAGFTNLQWVPLYDTDTVEESIYLIVRATK